MWFKYIIFFITNQLIMKKNFFVSNLETYMFANSLTREDIGREVKVSAQAVGRWLKDQRVPPHSTVTVIAGAMGVGVNDLLYKDLTFELLMKSGRIDDNIVREEGVNYGGLVSKAKVLRHLYRMKEQLEELMKENETAILQYK